MAAEFLARLFQERSQSRVIRFDESVVPRTSPEHLDDELTRRFLREECQQFAGRLPEYSLIDDSELRLVIWAA